MTLIDEFLVWYNDAHVLLKVAAWVLGILLAYALAKRLFKLAIVLLLFIILCFFACHTVLASSAPVM
jgi:hypothetical protein